MRDWRVTDGDLDITHSRQVDMVEGRDKLVQDLTLWLLEPLGIGYSTPAFGSTLNSIVTRDSSGRGQGRFIGRGPIGDLTTEVESEIDRVLNLYQQDQVQKIRQAKLEGRLYLYSKQEILNSIDNIASTQDQDVAIVSVDITTGANQDLSLLASIDSDEASISAS